MFYHPYNPYISHKLPDCSKFVGIRASPMWTCMYIWHCDALLQWICQILCTFSKQGSSNKKDNKLQTEKKHKITESWTSKSSTKKYKRPCIIELKPNMPHNLALSNGYTNLSISLHLVLMCSIPHVV